MKNLIYVFADQWRYMAQGSAGADPVLTPNMDRFCREATFCDSAISSFPLCTPHRGSLITGKRPLSLGLFTNCKNGLSMRLQDEETGIGQVLQGQGYQTAYIGKWHLDEPEVNHSASPVSGARDWDAFTPPGPRRHGFEYWYSYGTYDMHLTPHYWQDTPDRIDVSEWSPEHETTKAIEYLKEVRRKDQPFALYVSWNPPHPPYPLVPEKYQEQYRGELPLRGNVDLEEIRREGLRHHTGERSSLDEAGYEEVRRQYFAAVSGLDEQFGRLMEAVRGEGLLEESVIVLSADHGDMLGSHGLMGKHVYYEESVRIPLVIRVPGTVKKRCTTQIASEDQMPTILGLLGIPVPECVEGADLSRYVTEEGAESDREVYLCATPGRDVFLEKFRVRGKNPAHYGWRGIRTKRWKYMIEVGYDPEPAPARHLFDLKEDPLEMRDLMKEPGGEAVAADLEQKIMKHLQATGDGFVNVWKKKWIDSRELPAYEPATENMLQEAMDRCVRQVLRNLPDFTDAFPVDNSEGQFYRPGENVSWTTGFWTGELWLAYENVLGGRSCRKRMKNGSTPEPGETDAAEELKSAAERQVESFYHRIVNQIDVDHHDMGFLYIPSCVAAWKLTGNEKAKEAALLAAEHLTERYRPEGKYLQAWGSMEDENNRRLIIDCLLNVPLLFWAADVLERDALGERGKGQKVSDALRLRTIARNHIETTMKYIMREDNSTWHTIFFDGRTGAFSHGATCQGYRDSSAWARGQAWGVYGSAVAYRNTGNEEYLEYFDRSLDYFLSHLPEDLCPYWDLGFGMDDGDSEPRDSSSAAIVCCGLLEMEKAVGGKRGERCRDTALRILRELILHYQVTDPSCSNGQLLHGTYAKKTPYNTCTNAGVDECVTWGDYFFMEALQRALYPDWRGYW